MARRPGVHCPGALCRVISRGNQRQSIYKGDGDHRRLETLLGEVVKRLSITLYACVAMANHFIFCEIPKKLSPDACIAHLRKRWPFLFCFKSFLCNYFLESKTRPRESREFERSYRC